MMSKRFFLPTLLSLAVLSGCSAYQDKRATDTYSDDMGRITSERLNRNVSSVTLDAKRAAQDVNRPYITGKAIPLSREVTLPAPLRNSIDTTALFKDDGNLGMIAQKIKDFTGVPVIVKPEAYLPAEMFMPRLSRDGERTSPFPAAANSLPPGSVVLDSPLDDGIAAEGGSAVPVGNYRQYTLPPIKAGRQSLANVLDDIAHRMQVYWKYDDQIGAVVIYRTETRSFELRGAELAASVSMSSELRGGIDNANASGLGNKSKATLEMETRKEGPMEGIVNRVRQFMSVSGQLAFGAGSMIVVTDTKAALDQIEGMINLENKQRTRHVDFVFEEITIEKSTSAQAGVNWSLAFNNSIGDGFNTSGLNSLLEQEGAAASLRASVGSGLWKGSSIALQALSKVGKIVDQKVNSFGANNGQPATIGRPERQKYIDKLEQTQSFSATSSPTISVTQAEEVSGRVITVTPWAYSDGDINLAIKYDNTATPIFEKQNLPDGSYVQSPRSVGDVLQRTAILRSGQPYVISAQSANVVNYDERRTDRSAPMLLGGSDVAAKNDRVTVFVLTAMVREK